MRTAHQLGVDGERDPLRRDARLDVQLAQDLGEGGELIRLDAAALHDVETADEDWQDALDVERHLHLHRQSLQHRLLLHGLDVVDGETHQQVGDEDRHEDEEEDEERVRDALVEEAVFEDLLHVVGFAESGEDGGELHLTDHHDGRLEQRCLGTAERNLQAADRPGYVTEDTLQDPGGNVRRHTTGHQGQCQKTHYRTSEAMSEDTLQDTRGNVRRHTTGHQRQCQKTHYRTPEAMSEDTLQDTRGNVRRHTTGHQRQCQKTHCRTSEAMSEDTLQDTRGNVRRHTTGHQRQCQKTHYRTPEAMSEHQRQCQKTHYRTPEAMSEDTLQDTRGNVRRQTTEHQRQCQKTNYRTPEATSEHQRQCQKTHYRTPETMSEDKLQNTRDNVRRHTTGHQR